MFEANVSSMCPASGVEGAELRAFDWAELAARLAAARDLRSVTVRRREHACASFNRLAAGSFSAGANGKRDINPNGLGHGKSPWGNKPEVAYDAANGDREK